MYGKMTTLPATGGSALLIGGFEYMVLALLIITIVFAGMAVYRILPKKES